MNTWIRITRVDDPGLASDPAHFLRWLDGLSAPKRWKARRHGRVKWIGDQVPDSEVAAAIREALGSRGYETYGDVTRYVADLLLRRDLASGGWLADIGLFHSWYLLDACEALERLCGRLVQIEEEARP